MKILMVLAVLLTLGACQGIDDESLPDNPEVAAEEISIEEGPSLEVESEPSPPTELEYETFVSEEWGFQIDYPKGWAVEVSDQTATGRKWVFFETDNWNSGSAGVVGYRMFVRIHENGNLSEFPESFGSLVNGQLATVEAVCEPEQFVYAKVQLNESEHIDIEYIGPNVSDWERIVGSVDVLEKRGGETHFYTKVTRGPVCDEDDRKFQ